MNDPFTELEQELQELAPARPGDDFQERLAKALGPQGDLALRSVSAEEKLVPFRTVRNWAVAAGFVFLLGIAGASYYVQHQLSRNLAEKPVADIEVPAVPQEDEAVLAESSGAASPTTALETAGWKPLDQESVLVEVQDEGIVHEPSQPPAKQFRYRYFDTTTFTHPDANSEMRMTVPREQVFQVKLQPY